MFDFHQELMRYQQSLTIGEVPDPSKGETFSEDEVKDILDIARVFAENEVVGTRAAKIFRSGAGADHVSAEYLQIAPDH